MQPNDLTKVFRQARDKGGYYDHIENPMERPTFHDLRALGIFALAKAGYSVEYIQALAGHADNAKTEHYMLGHEQIRPVTVEADLFLDNVDWDTVDWDESLAPVLQAIIEEETEE